MLPTVGGQTGLNLALALSENGVLESVQCAADRRNHRCHPHRRGPPSVPRDHAQGRAAGAQAAARCIAWRKLQAMAAEAGYPLLVRASFALGGSGASWVYQPAELPEAVRKAVV